MGGRMGDTEGRKLEIKLNNQGICRRGKRQKEAGAERQKGVKERETKFARELRRGGNKGR